MDKKDERFVRDGWPTREYMRIINRSAHKAVFTTIPGLVSILLPFALLGVLALISKHVTLTGVHVLVFMIVAALLTIPTLIWVALTKGRRMLEEESKKVQQRAPLLPPDPQPGHSEGER